MNLLEVLNTRYSTKQFDPSKSISAENWNSIEQSFRLSPSSTNSQPWHFFVASDEEGKKRMTRGAEGKMAFNAQKILNCSHMVLLCSREDLSEDFLNRILEKEDQDGRFADPSFKTQVHNGRMMFAGIHKEELKDVTHWLEKQVYISAGFAMLSAALLGVDCVPLEGIDKLALSEEFSLQEKGLRPVMGICFGYHSEEDFNKKLPKSRLTNEEIFTYV